MEKKGYLDRWILPSMDLYDNLPNDGGRFYKGKPIGNSPEFMPLDTHLNRDLHTSHDLHVTITQALPDNDPRKFDGSTPNRLSDSYHRLFHPDTGVAPTSNRIMQDVTRVLMSLEMVLDADGCIIDETTRRGRRHEKRMDEDKNSTDKWGGKRTKMTQEGYSHILDKREAHLHSDAVCILQPNVDRMTHDRRHEEGSAIVDSDENISIY